MASTLTAAPPPPPPAAPQKAPPATKLPAVPPNGPKGAFLVELLMWNGFPFKDHWAFWVCSATHPKLGIQIHADGDVLHGFEFQIKRSQDFRVAGDIPTRRIPLQWVDGVYFDEKAMFNGGVLKVDNVPVCGFEESASKVKVPGKSLNAVKDQATSGRGAGKKITQRNCQTWIVEAADQLVRDGIFREEVAAYLYAIKP